MTAPTFCRIEYMDRNGDWSTGHQAFNFIDPQRYVDKMALGGKNGIFGICLTDNDGNKYLRKMPPTTCKFCDEVHYPPHDGRCLL